MKLLPAPAVAVTACVAMVTAGELIVSDAVKLKVIISPGFASEVVVLFEAMETDVKVGGAAWIV